MWQIVPDNFQWYHYITMISQIISIALHRCNCTAGNFNCNGNHFTAHNYGEFQWGPLKWSQWNIVTRHFPMDNVKHATSVHWEFQLTMTTMIMLTLLISMSSSHLGPMNQSLLSSPTLSWWRPHPMSMPFERSISLWNTGTGESGDDEGMAPEKTNYTSSEKMDLLV